MTNDPGRYDPLGDYRDHDGVLHRFDGESGSWWHPEAPLCRRAECPGNQRRPDRAYAPHRPLLENVGGGVFHPGQPDEYHSFRVRVRGVDPLVVAQRFADWVRELDHELRFNAQQRRAAAARRTRGRSK